MITKIVDTRKCSNGNCIKRGDKVTIETEAHLYSAELKGNKEPGHVKKGIQDCKYLVIVLVTLLGDHLWSNTVNISVGEDLLVKNWNQGIEGACPGDSRQKIIGPNMNMERIWNLSTSSQIPEQESITPFLLAVCICLFSVTNFCHSTIFAKCQQNLF